MSDFNRLGLDPETGDLEDVDAGFVDRDHEQEGKNFRKWVSVGLQRVQNHLELSVSEGLSKKGREVEWNGAWKLLQEIKEQALRGSGQES